MGSILPNSLISSTYYWKDNPAAWKEFEDYRVGLIVYLHDEFLARLSEIKNRKEGFHIIVTAMDNLTVPELQRNLGVDVLKIIELKNKYQFTLQVEDPLASGPPTRDDTLPFGIGTRRLQAQGQT